ncbi:MAG TPA: VWA domain-containing protein [Pyrinomonadaceae bacterium]|jgi:VWFA-related protein
MKPLLCSLAVAIACSLRVFAQEQTTGQPPPPPSERATTQTPGEDVVRITTNLVQVDVTVLNSKGQPVNDLTAEDFAVTEDGRPQKITNLSFITPSSSAAPPAASAVKPAARGAAPTPPPPPVTLRPEQVRRTIALVVDDLGLSQESSHFVRQSLRKFVDEQMQPGDLVAIIRTGAGMGALQQFTADKRMLYAAIERVQYNLNSRNFSAFGPIESTRGIASTTTPDSTNRGIGVETAGSGTEIINSTVTRTTPGIEASQYRDDIFSVGTLGALNYIVRGLRELTGRKSVILFSDGFRIYDQDQGSQRILDSLHQLIDLANRASVVIYTIDPRGLQALGLTAADDLSGPMSPFNARDSANYGDTTQAQWTQGITTDLQVRRRDFFATQQGLGYLAHQTGGFFVGNTNDIDGAVRRVLNDQKGYYLVGYRPDESTLTDAGRRGNFHHIEVKVTRPGLTVRTRTGFYGFTDEEVARPVYRTASQQLYNAISSPFASGDIRVRMSSVFGHDFKRGAFTESILHIDARDLVFMKLPDGTSKVSFQILAVTFGDNGDVVDQAQRSYSIVVQDAEVARVRSFGLIYIVTLPIKKPGAYQLRMAIRDSMSAHVGTANQFIEVPDIKKKRLTLSGVILSGTLPRTVTNPAASNPASGAGVSPSGATAATEGHVQEGHPLASQAVRRFQQGVTLNYGYYIYNARLNPSTRLPELETQVRLYRDGQLVFTGRATPFNAAGQTDMRQIVVGGALRLGTDLPPGQYVLQAIVIDKLAGNDASLATQWMDFDLVE